MTERELLEEPVRRRQRSQCPSGRWQKIPVPTICYCCCFVKVAAFVVKATIVYQDVYIIRFITVLYFINFWENWWHIIFLSLESHRQESVSRLL